MADSSIKVIDVFAGPGGLGEGFSAYRTRGNPRPFRVRLSIEMDKAAHATLKLRAFFRQFQGARVPEAYYEHLRRRLTLAELYEACPQQAKAADDEAWNATLGEVAADELRGRINRALQGAKKWVLIGGPPCQAYSLAGRARRTNDETFAKDKKHLLYREYLGIIADHQPPVFVMENVKGLLSATLEGRSTFQRILSDLKRPRKALGMAEREGSELAYRVCSLAKAVGTNGYLFEDPDLLPSDYVIESERFGIPQARHRVILLGIRADLNVAPVVLRPHPTPVSMWKAIGDLPPIRSGLSEEQDSFDTWCQHIRLAVQTGILSNGHVEAAISAELRQMMPCPERKLATGAEFIPWNLTACR